MQAAVDEHIGNHSDFDAGILGAHVPVGIMADLEGAVEWPDAFESRSASQQGLHHESREHLTNAWVAIAAGMVRQVRRPEILDLAGAKLELGPVFQPSHLSSEFVTMPKVVCVKKCDE